MGEGVYVQWKQAEIKTNEKLMPLAHMANKWDAWIVLHRHHLNYEIVKSELRWTVHLVGINLLRIFVQVEIT